MVFYKKRLCCLFWFGTVQIHDPFYPEKSHFVTSNCPDRTWACALAVSFSHSSMTYRENQSREWSQIINPDIEIFILYGTKASPRAKTYHVVSVVDIKGQCLRKFPVLSGADNRCKLMINNNELFVVTGNIYVYNASTGASLQCISHSFSPRNVAIFNNLIYDVSYWDRVIITDLNGDIICNSKREIRSHIVGAAVAVASFFPTPATPSPTTPKMSPVKINVVTNPRGPWTWVRHITRRALTYTATMLSNCLESLWARLQLSDVVHLEPEVRILMVNRITNNIEIITPSGRMLSCLSFLGKQYIFYHIAADAHGLVAVCSAHQSLGHEISFLC